MMGSNDKWQDELFCELNLDEIVSQSRCPDGRCPLRVICESLPPRGWMSVGSRK